MSKKNDIYRILGIDGKVKSRVSRKLEYGNPRYREEKWYDDPDAPSGSIFDNYSKYPKDPQNYWPNFRILTFVGIFTVLAIIVWMFSENSGGLKFSTPSFSHNDYYTENRYEEVVEIVEDVVEEQPVQVSAPGLPEKLYFMGEIDNNYGVTMYINTRTHRGEYYYNRNGNSSKNMHLTIQSIEKKNGGYQLVINEYNPSGDYCGRWDGFYNGSSYDGDGVYLGRNMPFELEECEQYQTGF